MEDAKNIALICKDCIKDLYPNKGKIDADAGDLVKVRFKIINDISEDIGYEYMWVEVTKSNKEGEYEGRLDNDPIYITNIKYGDKVIFKKEDIFDKVIISIKKEKC